MRAFKTFLLVSSLCLPLAAPVWAEDAPTISVTGSGMVNVAPDMATINLGVTTQAKTASEALAANSAQMEKVLANLLAAGIAEKDIQTSGLSINPLWNSYSSTSGNGEAQSIDGYSAANTVTVRVMALAGLGSVVDAAVSDGVNTLNGISFDLQDPAPQQDQARALAVADAKHRATVLIESAGLKLGAIKTISEGGSVGEPQPMYRLDQAFSGVPVAAGEVPVTATVTIVWEIAQP